MRRMTTYDIDAIDWAPHVEVRSTERNGTDIIPHLTAREFRNYVQAVEDHERGNGGVWAKDVVETDNGLTFYSAEYDYTETYREVARSFTTGERVYAVDGSWLWCDYNGPADFPHPPII